MTDDSETKTGLCYDNQFDFVLLYQIASCLRVEPRPRARSPLFQPRSIVSHALPPDTTQIAV